jgi:hypothetical protein
LYYLLIRLGVNFFKETRKQFLEDKLIICPFIISPKLFILLLLLYFSVSLQLQNPKMSLRVLNPNAEALNKSAAALHMNINAAKGLQDVLKINQNVGVPIQSSIIFLISIFFFYFPSFSRILFLRLVDGAVDIKFTKYGNTLQRNALFMSLFFKLTKFVFV